MNKVRYPRKPEFLVSVTTYEESRPNDVRRSETQKVFNLSKENVFRLILIEGNTMPFKHVAGFVGISSYGDKVHVEIFPFHWTFSKQRNRNAGNSGKRVGDEGINHLFRRIYRRDCEWPVDCINADIGDMQEVVDFGEDLHYLSD